MNYITHYILTALVFFAIDIVWLGFIARSFYRKYLANFLAPSVNWPAAIIFYLIFIVGILIFAVYPAAQKDSFMHALTYGALFGFFTYATYDLTNLATLNNWPLPIVFVDIIWGTVLAASVSIASFYILKMIV
jgi:uncharacterized membrane protein